MSLSCFWSLMPVAVADLATSPPVEAIPLATAGTEGRVITRGAARPVWAAGRCVLAPVDDPVVPAPAPSRWVALIDLADRSDAMCEARGFALEPDGKVWDAQGLWSCRPLEPADCDPDRGLAGN